jgi:lysophospholipase L1-like esterase
VVALGVAALPARAGDCTVPPDLLTFQAPLPKLLGAVRTNMPIRIVALGSSSTWGAGATSRAHTYPARLEQELRAAWPKSDVRVFNAGVGGQLARHMLARIDKDVAPRRPQLVLWQTGVNDAIKGVSIADYRQQLRLGVERLRAIGADVVLVDQQYYPSFKKVKDGPLYVEAMRNIAAELKVPMIQRYRIMQHLISSAQFTAATLLAPDQFHLNDRAYDCIGRLVAQSLRAIAIAPSAPPPAQIAVGKDEAL